MADYELTTNTKLGFKYVGKDYIPDKKSIFGAKFVGERKNFTESIKCPFKNINYKNQNC
jgi:hypothetical protein